MCTASGLKFKREAISGRSGCAKRKKKNVDGGIFPHFPLALSRVSLTLKNHFRFLVPKKDFFSRFLRLLDCQGRDFLRFSLSLSERKSSQLMGDREMIQVEAKTFIRNFATFSWHRFGFFKNENFVR